MSALKTFLAPAFLGTTLALSAGSAIALNVGDSDTFNSMKAKLENEKQVEVMTAAAGKMPNVRGVSFYYNKTNKIGYVTLTDNPATPTQMRIILQTKSTDFTGPVVVPQPMAGIQECEQLVSAGKAKKDDCGSLYATLKASADNGQVFFQQGILDNGSKLVSVMNVGRGEGNIYESTPNGATVTKIVFGAAKFTPEGTRFLPK